MPNEKTAEADAKFDKRGRRMEATDDEFGDNVLIVKQNPEDLLANGAAEDEQGKLF